MGRNNGEDEARTCLIEKEQLCDRKGKVETHGNITMRDDEYDRVNHDHTGGQHNCTSSEPSYDILHQIHKSIK